MFSWTLVMRAWLQVWSVRGKKRAISILKRLRSRIASVKNPVFPRDGITKYVPLVTDMLPKGTHTAAFLYSTISFTGKTPPTKGIPDRFTLIQTALTQTAEAKLVLIQVKPATAPEDQVEAELVSTFWARLLLRLAVAETSVTKLTGTPVGVQNAPGG